MLTSKFAVFCGILTFCFHSFYCTADVINIDSRRELFVDRYLIDQQTNTCLKMHEPVPHESVMTFQKPWEGVFVGYVSVLKDGDSYRMYYRGVPSKTISEEVTCYAESKDGIHWEKPNLGLYEINGTKENNVTLKGVKLVSHNFTPFIDTCPDAGPDQKYKALGGYYRYLKNPSLAGMYGLVSADGIRWKLLSPKPIIANPPQFAFDSQSVAFWSESEKHYVCYYRFWVGTDTAKGNFTNGLRWIAKITSPDFINWSDPVVMEIRHGGGDAPKFHLYTNQTWPYFRAPHIYIGTPARFMPDRQVVSEQQAKEVGVDPRYYKDCSDVLLLSSRGGNAYDQTFPEAFIRPGIGYENWVSRTNYPALNVVQTSETEMSLYVSQNYAQPSAYVRRYSLRLDGFASLHAGFEDGWMTTKPLIFKGDILTINYSTSAAGGIRVEIQNPDGTTIKGFEKENCTEIIGNEIERKVAWNPPATVADLQNQPVRLCFYMKDCDLYSFVFKSTDSK